MIWLKTTVPESIRSKSSDKIAMAIHGRSRDLGGFSVRRVLPAPTQRLVGPFIFFDHMGPVRFDPGRGVDVRPHPHINLATLTYLFEGTLVHKDSLGSDQTISPGDVNWMIAGRGIAHSERTGPKERASGAPLHGIQCWIALPSSHEEIEPRFSHHSETDIPRVSREGVELKIVAGSAYGQTSPVFVLSPLFYVEAQMQSGQELPLPSGYAERAAYVVKGAIEVEDDVFDAGSMALFRSDAPASIKARSDSMVMLLGGAPMDGERHIWWNFVSSSKERIEQAKRDWKAGRFSKVSGDEKEFIPLPEE